MVGNVVDEVFERQLSVGYHRGVPLFLTSVFTQGGMRFTLRYFNVPFVLFAIVVMCFNG